MSNELSDRAANFLDACVRTDAWAGPIRRETIAVDDALVDAGGGIDEALSRMVLFDERFGGRVISVIGGVLVGSLTLGCGARPSLWRSAGGEPVFRMAQHDSAQCAIVMSSSGQVGCSWSSEFHPLFDSIEHFIEDCAAWRQIRGWQYVAISDFDPGRVVGAVGAISPDKSASGEIARWWMADGVAVVAHPYLNPGRGSARQVAVLAADTLRSERVKEQLEVAGFGGQGSTAASLSGIVE